MAKHLKIIDEGKTFFLVWPQGSSYLFVLKENIYFYIYKKGVRHYFKYKIKKFIITIIKRYI